MEDTLPSSPNMSDVQVILLFRFDSDVDEQQNMIIASNVAIRQGSPNHFWKAE